MRLPYTPVEFTKSGDPADRRQFDAALAMIGTGTDVIMVAPGWNNDMPAAERMFTRLTDAIDILMAGRPGTGRSLTVVGLQWPSKRWGVDPEDTAGHGAGLGDDVTDLIGRIAMTVEDPAARSALEPLVPRLETDGAAQAEFLDILRGLLPPPEAVADDDSLPGTLRDGSVPEVLDAVEQAQMEVGSRIGAAPVAVAAGSLPPGFVPDPLAGAAMAAGLGFHFGKLNPLQALRLALNTTTFYSMKERAGNVGARGVAALLGTVAAARPEIRVHLAGHSFGARVVTAATATDTTISSVSLLQGAYSHRALAAADPALGMPAGSFRRALTGGQLHGPMIVTHTHNDLAVGLAYALASRLAHQIGAGLGDTGDPYGGIGANGAVATAEAVEGELGDQNTRYAFQPGRVHNLRGDRFISGHSDVTNPAVANAVLAAIDNGSR
ncbi:MAG TPA: hypothetical protein VGP91_14955 [Actinoplanes sp.]|nr:hypothetical protein [Actinoplanes sp.]